MACGMTQQQDVRSSPFSKLFRHHEEFLNRLVESTPSPKKRPYSHDEDCLLVASPLTDPFSDHVVRGSRSGNVRAVSSTFPHAPLHMPQNANLQLPIPPLGEIDPNNQRLKLAGMARGSPGQTLKKHKAEEILKQHGSPPNVRVTAGGRIVPSEQSPLCSPRYGYSAVNKNGGLIKFAPGYPPQPKTFPNFAKSLPNGFVAQDANGKLCQIVDGRFIEIQELNGIPQLYITAPNITNVAWSQFHAAAQRNINRDQASPAATISPPPVDTSSPPKAAQIAALEKQYQKLEEERRSLDKAEVLRREELTGKSFTHLIQKRRELVNRQDELRRSIKVLKDSVSGKGLGNAVTPRLRSSPDVEAPGITHALGHQHGFPWGPTSAAAPMHMQMVVPSLPAEYPILPPQPFLQTTMSPYVAIPFAHPDAVHLGERPSSTTFTAPHSNSRQPSPLEMSDTLFFNVAEQARADAACQPFSSRSGLNPMSPIYEPAQMANIIKQKHHDYAGASQTLDRSVVITERPTGVGKTTESQEGETSHVTSSESSYATADFFPHNPREHSLHKHAYLPNKQQAHPTHGSSVSTHVSHSDEAVAQPEMERHNVNWNPTIPDQAFHKNDASTANVSRGAGREGKKDATSASSTDASDDYARGYAAGLDREPIGQERGKSYLDGYCKGLLQSAQLLSSPAGTGGNVTESKLPETRNDPSSGRPSKLEPDDVPSPGRLADVAVLKQAIAAPSNENALLSPLLEGPSVDDVKDKSFGAWAKNTSDNAALRQHGSNDTDAQHREVSMASVGLAPHDQVKATDFALGRAHSSHQQDPSYAQRTFSAQTQPALRTETSFLQKAYPGHRVLSSPALDWKMPNSIAQAASHATGFFAHFDGTGSKPGSAKTADNDDCVNTSPLVTKFTEASMPEDDVLNSPTKSTSSSPRKSPTKAKFAAIAGKAGIKVRSDRPPSKEANDLEPMSPQERRRWRNVWKKRYTGEA